MTDKDKVVIKICRQISKFDGGQFEAKDLDFMINFIANKYLSKNTRKRLSIETDSCCFPIKIKLERSET